VLNLRDEYILDLFSRSSSASSRLFNINSLRPKACANRILPAEIVISPCEGRPHDGLRLTVILLCPVDKLCRHVLPRKVEEIVYQKARGWTWWYGLDQLSRFLEPYEIAICNPEDEDVHETSEPRTGHGMMKKEGELKVRELRNERLQHNGVDPEKSGL